jgi:polyphosphate kinase 2 (PPK2 family)
MKKLYVELDKLQEWVTLKGLKVCIVFEGRDGAGKGGTIKAITERTSMPWLAGCAICRRQGLSRVQTELCA